jgi:bacteriorhodopsin
MFRERAYPKAKQFNYTTALMNFMTAAAYFFMALDIENANVAFPGVSPGTVANGKGGFRDLFWMRYLNWFFSTALVLLNLGMLAGFEFWDNFLMIVLHMCSIGALYVSAAEVTIEWQAFVVFLFFFISVMFFLTLGVLNQANAEPNDERAARMTTLLWLTVISLAVIPIGFVLGQRNVMSRCFEVVFFAIVDAITKPIFGILLLADEDLLVPEMTQMVVMQQPQIIS